MGKIKVGFVGAGWMGSCQMQRITDCNDTEIVALFEKNMGHGKLISDNHSYHPVTIRNSG